MRPINYLAAVAAAVTAVEGAAHVHNFCDFPVYLWAVDKERVPSEPTVLGPGEKYSEEYHTPSIGGVSLKLSKNKECKKITQFEYTKQPGFIWYDGSNVDCTGTECPFQAHGVYMETSKGAGCPTRTCEPGAPTCTGFYTLWNDDINSLSCQPDADIMMYLCATSNKPKGGGSGGQKPKVGEAGGVKAADVDGPKNKAKEIHEAVVTTFLTLTQTEYVKRAASTPQARRAEHAPVLRHRHAHPRQ